MSTDKVSVNIKSNQGSTVNDINNLITEQKTRPNTLESADIIIVHAGINNISNADKPSSICEDFTQLTYTLKSLNKSAKIAISSILPKKRDLLSKDNITETNIQLNTLCREKGYIFIDTYKGFTSNSKVSQNLFYDEVHVNAEGSRTLGMILNSEIRNILGLEDSSLKKPVNFRFASNRQRTDHQHHFHGQPPRGYQKLRSRWPQNYWVLPPY
jgi:lysophospholipase L1-like esterase